MVTKPIYIIGPYPPLVGGVSTHIERILPLTRKRGMDVHVMAVNKDHRADDFVEFIPTWQLPIRLLLMPSSIVHLHVDAWYFLLLCRLLGWRHRFMLTVHHNRYPTQFLPGSFVSQIKKWSLRSFWRIVCVNEETLHYLKSMGCNVYPKEVPAFLPPVDIDFESVNDIKDWAAHFDYVLSGYAYRLSFYKDEDLYGIDMMIELMDELIHRKGKSVGLALVLSMDESPYLSEIKSRISTKGLSSHVKLIDINRGIDANALWSISSVYLRPTNTDGDSISVREALYVGTTVVASDCVKRPEGCLLFTNRDQSSMNQVVLEAITQSRNPVTTKDSVNLEYYE